MNPLQADVAIIGAGIAGLTCALELLEHGQRRVLIIDRDQPERLGGLARESFGGMFAVDTPEQRRAGIRDSIDLAWADWQSFAEFEPDAVWPRQWAHAYVTHCTEHMYLWLRGRGARYFPVPNWVERGLYTPGNSVPRFHMVWGTGEKLVLALLTQLEPYLANGALQLRCGLRVDALEQEGGQVVGCRGVANDSGSAFTVSAGQVVIAGGGINGGDLSRVRAHWHRDWRVPPELILNGSHRYADGTLHDAAQALGGRITHLDKQWNYAAGVHHYTSSKPHAGLSLVPPKSALWLNWRGQRIGPQPLVSGYDTRDLVRQVCAQERGYSWMLLNQRIALKELAVSGAEHNPSIRDQHWLAFLRDILLGNRWLLDTMLTRCVDFVQADTLPELAARMNALQGDDAVELATLQQATQSYDAQFDRPPALRNDEQLRRIAHLRQYRGDRVRTCKAQRIVDEHALPLIAIRCFIISRKSLGGIQTDLQSRVLGAERRPINGLYAVGEAAGFGGGGVHGLRALEGTFLGGCVLSARAAAQSILGRGSLLTV